MSKTRVIDEMQEIRRLRILGFDKQHIMHQMNLSRHSYENRVLKINQIDQEYVLNRFHNEIATEMVMLQERLLSTIRICEQIATNENIEAQYRIQALNLKVWCSTGMVRLMQEGPNVLKTYLGDSIIAKQSKLESLFNHNDNNNKTVFDADHPPPPDFDTSDWRYGEWCHRYNKDHPNHCGCEYKF